MSKTHFPFPSDNYEIIALLNASRIWNASVVREGDVLLVYDGDQPMFEAATDQEINDFLAGCFLTTFNGNELTAIRREIASGRGTFGPYE